MEISLCFAKSWFSWLKEIIEWYGYFIALKNIGCESAKSGANCFSWVNNIFEKISSENLLLLHSLFTNSYYLSLEMTQTLTPITFYFTYTAMNRGGSAVYDYFKVY